MDEFVTLETIFTELIRANVIKVRDMDSVESVLESTFGLTLSTEICVEDEEVVPV